MKLPLILLSVLSCISSAWSLAPEKDAVFVRVVDVGAGLCCVVKLPGGHNIVYDTGNFKDDGKTAFAAVEEFIPETEAIDLLVLSHTDGDHIAATGAICKAYEVKHIFHPGLPGGSDTWKAAKKAIAAEKKAGCEVTNLNNTQLTPGTSFTFGDVKATLVCGFAVPPKEWGLISDGERKNAGSIILRLTYRGRSMIFCGDAVGRHIGDPDATCIAEEKFMIDHKGKVPIKANVMVAPHHGADNGSSAAFIKAVAPTFVIFSAGHNSTFIHPRQTTANRYLAAGIKRANMFRTDRGDNEGPKEWEGKATGLHSDPAGDDDVDVLIRKNKQIVVEYANP